MFKFFTLYRKRIFDSTQTKKLEEFVQILGNEFDFKNEKVDRTFPMIQYPNFKEKQSKSPKKKQ